MAGRASYLPVLYSLYAPFYDVLVARATRRARGRAIGFLAPVAGERLLIAGAGTGLDLEALPRGLRVAAFDASRAMVRRTGARAERLGLRVARARADAQALPFADGAFDIVLLHLILAVVPEPERCLREAVRVLAPGGRISIFGKFLRGDAPPSAMRRAAGAVTRGLATDINLRLAPLLDAAGLVALRDEPVLLGGFFRAVLARRAVD